MNLCTKSRSAGPGMTWTMHCVSTMIVFTFITTASSDHVCDADFALTTFLFKTCMLNVSNGSEVKRRRNTVREWEGERLRGWWSECPQIQ